jgi:hypothetical protein
MAALAVTNAFVAGTNIVASQMNANFTDVVTWATPTLSTSGSATTVSGTLSVTEAATFDALATFKNYIKLTHDLGASAAIYWEGATDNDFETYLRATDPTADRIITLPDATGTVALTSDITTPVTAVTGTAPIVSSGGYTPAISITTNDAQLILNNTVFN